MSEVMRAGLVGIGFGVHNAQAVQKNPRGQMVALCDLDEKKMDEFAEKLGGDVKKYTDYGKMCRDEDVDCILIWTPNQLHVPMGLEAIRNGKHIMITKPLADRADTAKELIDEAEKSGLVNMMSLSTRFSPGIQYLGRLAREGRFGELYYCRAISMRRNGIPHWNLGFIEKGGGAFRDMGVHVLDSAWWVMGMPKPLSVTGVAGARFGPRGLGYMSRSTPPEEYYSKYDSDDYAGGFIRFENGVGMVVESHWASHQPDSGLHIDIFGTDAGAQLDPITVYSMDGSAEVDARADVPKGPSSWDAMADALIASILDGAECPAPLRHGLAVQEMLEALLASAEEGKEVRLG